MPVPGPSLNTSEPTVSSALFREPMAITRWISFGGTPQAPSVASSHVDAALVATVSSADSKEFGLENFGNTCYANSVLQTLYFCNPFRELLLQLPDPSVPQPPFPTQQQASASTPQLSGTIRRKPERKFSANDGRLTSETLPRPATGPPIPLSPPTLSSALRSLFVHISKNPADKGTVAPRAFIEKLRQLNELFRSQMHQDAHEFLNYLLNRVVEEIQLERREGTNCGPSMLSLPPDSAAATLVHKLFEGVLTSETRCLTCETVSSREESFLDLSIDIEQNSSVTACLRQFSASEMLCQKNKFFCDSCCDLQEAEKRMKIKKLPIVLALHLKRFKYQEELQKYIKLTYRVAFPMELRLFNTVDDAEDPDRLYELYGIVVHIGNGPHHGHYVSIIKANGSWKIFDDDNVDTIKESDIPKYFGDSNSGAAYVLYYQAVDIDLSALGLRPPMPSPPPSSQPVPEPLSDDLPVPALPPGLTCDNDSSDPAESYSPATPTVSSSEYSPEISGSPTLKAFESSQDSPPLINTVTATTQQKPSGSLFHTIKHSHSTVARPTFRRPDSQRQLSLEAPRMAASLSASSSIVPPLNLKHTSRSGPLSGPVAGMPPGEEPLPLPSKVENPTWYSRKGNLGKEKVNLATTFAATRTRKKNEQDNSTSTEAPNSDYRTRSVDSQLSLVSTTAPRSPSLLHPPSPELKYHNDRPPPVKFRRPLPPRPSSAGGRIISSLSSSSLKYINSPASGDAPPVPLLPTSPISSRTPKSPPAPPPSANRRENGDNSPTRNGNVHHRKRPNSAHGHVRDTFSTPVSFSNATMHPYRPTAGHDTRTSPTTTTTTTNNSNPPSTWKRKLSITGTMLGFMKKEKHKHEATSPI